MVELRVLARARCPLFVARCPCIAGLPKRTSIQPIDCTTRRRRPQMQRAAIIFPTALRPNPPLIRSAGARACAALRAPSANQQAGNTT